MFPVLAPELPPIHESAAQFAHEVVALLERHGSIDAALFAQLLSARPLRRAQIMSAAFALSIDKAAIEVLAHDGETTHVFRSPMIVEPKLVDALEGLVLERERASPDDPRRGALSEDIERLAAQLRTRRPVKGGERVAGTILEYLIGRGTFGSVWRSRDAETGAPRATKIFDVNRLTEGIMLWRFRRSFRALQILNKHRGAPASIAKVFTVAEDGLAFAMEYLPRGSLDKVAQRSFTLGQRITIFSEICRAVAFAHSVGVIHRDIKPANVMFDANLRPVLIDFDIADVQFLTEQHLTVGGLGTPMFAAPEQLECAGEVDERADIYSLGRMLHYMLVERVPTYAEQEDLLVENLSRFPPSLSYTVRKATQRQPDDRFKDVNLLRREVEAYKTGLAAIQANIRRSAHWIRKNAVALVLATCATSGALLYAKHQEMLASARLEVQLKLQDSLAEVVVLTDRLQGLERQFGELRLVQVDLRGRLDEAKATLAQIKAGELVLAPQVLKARSLELSTKIGALEVEFRQVESRLDSVRSNLGTTLDELDRVSREDATPLKAVEPPPPPKAVAEPRVELDSAPVASPGSSVENKPKTRKPPATSTPRSSGERRDRRQAAVRKAVKRLQANAWFCRRRDREFEQKDDVGFVARINAGGEIEDLRFVYGGLSVEARRCIIVLIRGMTVEPLGEGAESLVHSLVFKSRMNRSRHALEK
jgi:serine/threonine protein kinase